jgi:uncharacterized RDD family membrane protein YckC
VLAPDDAAERPLPAGLLLAPLWRRLLARLVDEVPFLAVQVLGVVLLGDVRIDDEGIAVDQPLGVVLGVVALGVVYETVLVAWRGATLGKLLFDLVVVRADSGRRPDRHQAALRALVPAALGAVPVLGPALALGAMSWAVWSPLRQGLHDRAAGTLVVLDPDR